MSRSWILTLLREFHPFECGPNHAPSSCEWSRHSATSQKSLDTFAGGNAFRVCFEAISSIVRTAMHSTAVTGVAAANADRIPARECFDAAKSRRAWTPPRPNDLHPTQCWKTFKAGETFKTYPHPRTTTGFTTRVGSSCTTSLPASNRHCLRIFWV